MPAMTMPPMAEIAKITTAVCMTRFGSMTISSIDGETNVPLAAGIDPRDAVARRAHVVVVPAVFGPFRHVAVDVEKPERIRRKAVRRRRSPEAVAVTRKCLRPAPLRWRAVAFAGEIAERL